MSQSRLLVPALVALGLAVPVQPLAAQRPQDTTPNDAANSPGTRDAPLQQGEGDAAAASQDDSTASQRKLQLEIGV